MMKSKPKSGKDAKMMSYKKGGMVFKPCAGCPNPAACQKAGACMKKAGKK
jgi:hypothetical protein